MSGAQWFWVEGGERCGPASTRELRDRLEAGGMSWTTPVWRAGLSAWSPALDVEDLRPRADSSSTPDVEAPPYRASQHLAPIWRRCLAKALDFFLLAAACELMAVIAAPLLPPRNTTAHEQLMMFVLAAVYWLYYTAHEGGSRRASLGKSVFRIEVVDAAGNSLRLAQSATRAAVSLLTLGWLFALFGTERQCLHDRLSRSYVVHRSPRPDEEDPVERD